jgi:hypothetical protein
VRHLLHCCSVCPLGFPQAGHTLTGLNRIVFPRRCSSAGREVTYAWIVPLTRGLSVPRCALRRACRKALGLTRPRKRLHSGEWSIAHAEGLLKATAEPISVSAQLSVSRLRQRKRERERSTETAPRNDWGNKNWRRYHFSCRTWRDVSICAPRTYTERVSFASLSCTRTHTHTHKQACILVTRQWGRGGLEIIFNCYKWRRGTLPLLLRISLPFCSPLAQPRRRERVSDANLQQSQARTRRATQRYTQHDLKNQRRSWQHCFRVLCVGRHVNGSMKTTASARRNEWGEKPLFRFLLFLSVVV